MQIDEQLPRHMIWHRAARALLGLPPAEPPYTDYISAMVAFDPAIVRRMLARVTATTGRPWTTAIARQLHFSEWTLYGVFVDEVIGAPANSFASDDPLCLTYWDETPLDCDGAADFLGGIRPTDVAAMISAKSRTPLAVRRAAFAATERADCGPPIASGLRDLMSHAFGRMQAELVPDSRQVSPAVPRRQKIVSHRAKRKKIRWPVFLFLIALVVPWVIYVGPLRMSLYRIVLLVMVLPCLGMWMAGKAGRKRTADIALMLYWFWCTLSFIDDQWAAVTVQSSGIGFR